MKWHEEIGGGGCGGGSYVRFEMEEWVIWIKWGGWWCWKWKGTTWFFIHETLLPSWWLAWGQWLRFFLFLLYSKCPLVCDMLSPFFLSIFQNDVSVMLKHLFFLRISFCHFILPLSTIFVAKSMIYLPLDSLVLVSLCTHLTSAIPPWFCFVLLFLFQLNLYWLVCLCDTLINPWCCLNEPSYLKLNLTHRCMVCAYINILGENKYYAEKNTRFISC